MEEDPSDEWEVEQIYSYPSQGSSNSQSEGLWHKGLRLGKRIAVTGVLISSAPLVLPPLVALSALGFALSVPFGFVLGSYMCTEKLMSRLLSEPEASSPFSHLGYESMCLDEGEGGRSVTEGWYNEVFKDRVAYVESYDIEKKELEEGVRMGIEVKVELDDDGDVENDKCITLPADNLKGEELKVDVPKSLEMHAERCEEVLVVGDEELPGTVFPRNGDNEDGADIVKVIDNKIEANGYEEDDGELMEEEGEQPPMAVDELLTGIRQAEGQMLSTEERGNRTSVDDEKQPLDAMEEMLIKRIGEAEDAVPSAEQIWIDLQPLDAKVDLPSTAVQETLEGNEVEGENSLAVELPVGGCLTSGDGRLRNKTCKEEGISSLKGRWTEVPVGNLRRQQPSNAVNENEIMKGIREAENKIAMMEKKGYKMPVDAARAAVLVAEVGGKNDRGVEQSEGLGSLEPRGFNEKSISRVKFGDVKPDELERETTGLLEEIRDEGRADNEIPLCLESEVSPVVPEGGHPRNSRNSTGEVKMTSLEEALDIGEDDVTIEGTAQSVQGSKIPEAGVMPEVVMPAGKDGGVTLGSPVVRTEYASMVTQTWVAGPLTVHGLASEERVPGVEKECVLCVEKSMHIQEETDHDRNRSPVLSDADASEIADGSGLSIFEGEDQTSGDVVASGEGYQEIPVSWGATKLGSDETAPEKETTIDHIEVMLDQSRIWEQIYALRTVLGYKSAIHSTCVEELNALYIFTGIEPPASVRDNSDLADLNEKVQFLMAIVGVKVAPSG